MIKSHRQEYYLCFMFILSLFLILIQAVFLQTVPLKIYNCMFTISRVFLHLAINLLILKEVLKLKKTFKKWNNVYKPLQEELHEI